MIQILWLFPHIYSWPSPEERTIQQVWDWLSTMLQTSPDRLIIQGELILLGLHSGQVIGQRESVLDTPMATRLVQGWPEQYKVQSFCLKLMGSALHLPACESGGSVTAITAGHPPEAESHNKVDPTDHREVGWKHKHLDDYQFLKGRALKSAPTVNLRGTWASKYSIN